MSKLKSRKFWITIALAGYGAIMGIRALGAENTIATAICVVAAAAVGIGYVFAEAFVDAESNEEFWIDEESED